MSSLAATRTRKGQVESKKTPHEGHTILPNITSLLVNILKLPQCLDDINALARPCDDQLRSLMETVVQHLQSLQDVSPVLAFVVQALIDHVHNLVELG